MADSSKEKLKATKRVKPRKDAKPTSSLAAEKAQLKEEKAQRAARAASLKAAKENKAAEKEAAAVASADVSAGLSEETPAAPAEETPSKRTASRRKAPEKEKKPKGPKFEFSREGLRVWALAHTKGLIIAGVVVLCLVALYSPVATYYGAMRTNAVLSARLESAKSDEETLSNDVSKLTSEEGIRDEARRRGYVDEGDTAVDIEGLEDSGSAATDSTLSSSSTEAAEDPWYIVALDFIFGYSAENQGVS